MRENKSKRLTIVLTLMMIAACFWITGQASADDQSGPMVSSRMKVSGEITRVQSGVLHVKTSWGQMTVNDKSLQGPKVGDHVDLWVDEHNTVIDIHRKGESVPLHRLITGNLAYTSPDKIEMKLWTPDGEKAFPVGAAKAKLGNVQEGSQVTVELNEKGEVIDVHKTEISFRLDAGAKTRPGYHLQVNGTVSKIKGGMVFVKTQTGEVVVNPRLGLNQAKVGDEVSLWINESNVVVDAHKKGETSHHRFIIGKLAYASNDKKEIKLWTPEGEKTFAVARNKSKLSAIKEGTLIRVEVNENGDVIDLRKTG